MNYAVKVTRGPGQEARDLAVGRAGKAQGDDDLRQQGKPGVVPGVKDVQGQGNVGVGDAVGKKLVGQKGKPSGVKDPPGMGSISGERSFRERWGIEASASGLSPSS